MVFFPNCKINIGLHITGKRADGFHNLETIFYPLLLQDGLEIIHNTEGYETTLNITGITIDGPIDDNICLKAYHLLKKDFPKLPAVQMYLHKAIPTGAGLGGGSADGAFTLLLLNKKFNLQLTQAQLIEYALQLGSDCPFFIINKPAFATGRGEVLTPVGLDLTAYKLVIVNPQIHVNTGWAFSQIKPASTSYDLKEAVQKPIEQWKGLITNDFELPVCRQHPEIATIKNELYAKGAVYASMSGTGSTVYGFFPQSANTTFNFPQHYFTKQLM